jgi:hypothetical protein
MGIRKKIIACPATTGSDARTTKKGVIPKELINDCDKTLIYSRKKNKSCFRVSGTNSFSACSFRHGAGKDV